MNNSNIRFDGLERLINETKIEMPTMLVPEIKDRKTRMLEKIEEKTEDICNNNKNQFWKNVMVSIVSAIIGSIVTYLITLI